MARPSTIAWWRTDRARGVVFQAALVLGVVALAAILLGNASETFRRQNLQFGFGFLDDTAGFAVIQALVPYDETSTYARVLLVGVLNTLLAAAAGIVLATALGFLIGIGQLSTNWLIARLCRAYVEILRNLPLLLQVFFWYFGVLRALPGPRDSFQFGDFYLNARGLHFPSPEPLAGFFYVVAASGLGAILAAGYSVWSRERRERTGKTGPVALPVLALLIFPPLVAASLTGFPLAFSLPALTGLNFEGGGTLLPEFIALVFALATYTASYIAEIVRAGIVGVASGQTEAGKALGLSRGQILRLVVVPQALRQIVPPLTSQYLNLTKNSSLAVAIGYPELVSVFAGTTLNQTGRAVEIIAITMGVYLTISLLTSFFMNRYNASVAQTAR